MAAAVRVNHLAACLVQDCMVKPPFCDEQLGECGSKFVWVYFLTFYLAVGGLASSSISYHCGWGRAHMQLPA